MFRRLVCISLCLLSLSVISATTSSRHQSLVPPEGGPYLWPYPATVIQTPAKSQTKVYINPSNLNIEFSSNFDPSLHIVGAAINRFRLFAFPYVTNGYQPSNTVACNHIFVNVSDDLTYFNIDETNESYNLTVSSDGEINIYGASIFGAMYGLTTLSQLIEYTSSPQPAYVIPYATITIQDTPAHPWRGIMIDTSRHYLSIATIQRTIIAMSLNKLNTLHWHVGDAYSFPWVSTAFPQLSSAGAYADTAVYSPTDVQALFTFARDRGVQIVPEFNMPGHVAGMSQWVTTVPYNQQMANDAFVACPQWLNSSNPYRLSSVALNPTSSYVYTFLESFLLEQSVLPTDYIHLGGNDVQGNNTHLKCYESNANIQKWITNPNHTMSISELPDYFWSQMYASVIPTVFVQNSTNVYPILWADHTWKYNSNISLDTTYQVYDTPQLLANITKLGYPVISSVGWILNADHSGHTPTWSDLYNMNWFYNTTSSGQILGGEAILWGTEASDFTIDTLLWPRASAVAERLWTPTDVVTQLHTNTTQWRLDLQACRMSRRRIRAAPSIPGFCAFANDYVGPTSPQVGLSYAAFYTLIVLSVIGGMYILAVLIKQIAVVRAATQAKKHKSIQDASEPLLA